MGGRCRGGRRRKRRGGIKNASGDVAGGQIIRGEGNRWRSREFTDVNSMAMRLITGPEGRALGGRVKRGGVRRLVVHNYNVEFRHAKEEEEVENTNQPEAEAEPAPEAEGEGRVPAHLYFQDNKIQDMQAEDIAILTESYDDAYTNGDQEEMLAIQDQIDWWTTVL